MTDPASRDSGLAVPGSGTVPAAPAAPAKPMAPAGASSPKVFVGDLPFGPDALGIEEPLSLLAELAIHKQAESPLCIGILGAAGSGKSFALKRLGAVTEALAARASGQKDTPFFSGVHVVQADAADFHGEPMTALAGALCTGLGAAAPDLTQEALQSVRDPHAAVAEAADRLDQAQRRLRAERDNLTEVEGRRARLFDALLYETPGSQVDAYVRTYRSRIASRLQAFGFSGDPVLNYKDLVASLAAVQSPGGSVSLALRSLWAFKGQTRLLVYAILLALVGAGLDWAVAHQDIWLAPMRGGSNAALTAVATWFEAHIGVLEGLEKAAFAGAALAALINLWRAFRFLQPILRGVKLLKLELSNRSHELDSALAHQTRRVDGLAAEVEKAARLHADADAQAGKALPQNTALNMDSPFQSGSEKTKAVHFVSTLAGLIGQKQKSAEAARKAPQRILVILDNLDAVPPARACEILDAAHRLLSHSVFVTAVGVDPKRLAEVGPGVQAQLEKWVQVPLRIDATATDHVAFIAHLMGEGAPQRPTKAVAVSGTATSSLDRPLSEAERQLLTELAPLAGTSARSMKRFVNLYRLTRSLLPDNQASLAFMLALKSGGTPDEAKAVADMLAGVKPGADLTLPVSDPQFSAWLSMVRTLETGSTSDALKQAAPIAACFSFY